MALDIADMNRTLGHTRAQGPGAPGNVASRVDRYEQMVARKFQLTHAADALCSAMLMLRGPQTLNELLDPHRPHGQVLPTVDACARQSRPADRPQAAAGARRSAARPASARTVSRICSPARSMRRPSAAPSAPRATGSATSELEARVRETGRTGGRVAGAAENPDRIDPVFTHQKAKAASFRKRPRVSSAFAAVSLEPEAHTSGRTARHGGQRRSCPSLRQSAEATLGKTKSLDIGSPPFVC